MKRLTIVALFLVAMITGQSYGTMVHVGTLTGDSLTVATGASALTDTDTLYIRAGTFTEVAKITLADSCVVIGQGIGTTIVDLWDSADNGLLISDTNDKNPVQIRDLTIKCDSSYVAVVTGATTASTLAFTNVRFTADGSDNTTLFVGDPDYTTTFTGCQFAGTSTTAWIEVMSHAAVNSASGPVFNTCTFSDVTFDADDIYTTVELNGCTGTFSPPTLTASAPANLYFFDYLGDNPTRPLAVVIKNCTFTGATTTGTTADSLNLFWRASHDVSSDSIYNNTFDEFEAAIYLSQADAATSECPLGSGSYIVNNTMTDIQQYGICVSTNTGTLTGNTITMTDATTATMYGIVLGDPSRSYFVDDSTHAYNWVVSGNTVSVFGGYAFWHTGDYSKIYQNSFSGRLGGYAESGRDAYIAHNDITGGNYGLYFVADISTNAPHDNTFKNNRFVAQATYNPATDSCFIKSAGADEDSLNYFRYNAWDPNGRTVSAFWKDSTTTYTFDQWQDVLYGTTLHGIKSGNDLTNWQTTWGGDTSFVITPTYNWYTIGSAQWGRFPTITKDFKLLSDADSLMLNRGVTWKPSDIVVWPLDRLNRDQYEYENRLYIDRGMDLHIVTDQDKAAAAWD